MRFYKERTRDGRDVVALDIAEMLARVFQTACAKAVKAAAIQNDARAALVPIQLSGLRTGAARAFGQLFPASTTLATIDALFRENLPTGASWWESAPVS